MRNALTYMLMEIDALIDEEAEENTPRRWLEGIKHFCRPYDPAQDLKKVFLSTATATTVPADKYNHGMLVQTNIPYRALCAHHLFPVLGVAHVGYIPTDKVVGLSKLARLVYGISHESPSLQEHVGMSIVQALVKYLNGLGAMCIINAEHGCMSCRGVEEHNVATVTSHVDGVFKDAAIRDEFIQIVRMNSSK